MLLFVMHFVSTLTPSAVLWCWCCHHSPTRSGSRPVCSQDEKGAGCIPQTGVHSGTVLQLPASVPARPPVRLAVLHSRGTHTVAPARSRILCKALSEQAYSLAGAGGLSSIAAARLYTRLSVRHQAISVSTPDPVPPHSIVQASCAQFSTSHAALLPSQQAQPQPRAATPAGVLPGPAPAAPPSLPPASCSAVEAEAGVAAGVAAAAAAVAAAAVLLSSASCHHRPADAIMGA